MCRQTPTDGKVLDKDGNELDEFYGAYCNAWGDSDEEWCYVDPVSLCNATHHTQQSLSAFGGPRKKKKKKKRIVANAQNETSDLCVCALSALRCVLLEY